MFKNNLFSKRSLSLKTTVFVSMMFLVLTVVFLTSIEPVLAQVDTGTDIVEENIGLAATDPRLVAARIIRIALTFLGIVAVGLILYAGFIWMTSGGNEERVGRAKKILINAVIGLAIILSAWGITTFIIGRLIDATGGGGGGGGAGGGGVGGGALGNGIIQNHYPERNATDIPRNTKIFITFKEKMLSSTISIYDTNSTETEDDDTGNIKIHRTYCTGTAGTEDDGSDNDGCFSNLNEGENWPLGPTEVIVSTADADTDGNGKTYVFTIPGYLGSEDEYIWHTVYLGSGIQKANGDPAFGGDLDDDYDWKFEVSTELDLSPPHVINSWPKYKNYKGLSLVDGFVDFYSCADSRSDCGAVPKNAVPYIDFNEPVDPTMVIGDDPEGLIVYQISYDASASPPLSATTVAGEFIISNGYKTVSFLPDSECGTNSCGDKIYCLPENADLIIVARAATLVPCDKDASTNTIDCQIQYGAEYECIPTMGDSAKDACHLIGNSNEYYPEAGLLFDGVMDAAGNSLDGNKPLDDGSSPDFGMPYTFNGDKLAQGSSYEGKNWFAVDDFYWYFFTSEKMDLTPPNIEVADGLDPGLYEQGVGLDKIIEISFSELILKYTLKGGCGYDGDSDECYITLASGKEGEKIGYSVNAYDININDDDQTNDKTNAQITHGNFSLQTDYTIGVTSNILDCFQNCYQPCRGPSCWCDWNTDTNTCENKNWNSQEAYPDCVPPPVSGP